MATPPQSDTPTTELQHSAPRRTIVLVGRKGAGKSTVANALSGSEHFEVSDVHATKTKDWFKYRTVPAQNNTEHEFYMIEATPTMETIKVKPPPKKISMLAFVFRYGHFTNEDLELFRNVINISGKNPSLANCSVVIVTGCEDLSEETKEGYRVFLKSDEIMKTFSDFTKKADGIYCVGLPKLKGFKKKNKDIYEEDIEKSTTALRGLAESCSELCNIDFSPSAHHAETSKSQLGCSVM